MLILPLFANLRALIKLGPCERSGREGSAARAPLNTLWSYYLSLSKNGIAIESNDFMLLVACVFFIGFRCLCCFADTVFVDLFTWRLLRCWLFEFLRGLGYVFLLLCGLVSLCLRVSVVASNRPVLGFVFSSLVRV